MRQKAWALALTVGLMGAGGAAQAGLISYTSAGVGLVYDTDYTPVGASSPGLTWTADANLFKTQYDADNTVVSKIINAVPTVTDGLGAHTVVAGDFTTANGRMTWWGAMAWAGWLGKISYGGADDWRLWSALNSAGTGPCGGYDCTGSELGHLFYTEGQLSKNDAINDSTALQAVFTNMQDNVYWSGTEFAPDPNYAWLFITDIGYQGYDYKDYQFYGWAVRPGQVAAAPLPGTALLMALGFAALPLWRRGRRRLR